MMSSLIVVDDNEIDRLIVKYSLRKYPVFTSVIYYGEGTTLINYLETYKTDTMHLPDVIFLDLRMPHYDGWQVLDDINALYPKLQKNIIVYIVSASISSQDRFRAFKYSFVRQFISKPITQEILITLSHQLLNKTA